MRAQNWQNTFAQSILERASTRLLDSPLTRQPSSRLTQRVNDLVGDRVWPGFQPAATLDLP